MRFVILPPRSKSWKQTRHLAVSEFFQGGKKISHATSGEVPYKIEVSLDTKGGVAHPVVVVGSAGRLQIRGGHHSARLVNVELRLVPVLLEAHIFDLVEGLCESCIRLFIRDSG